MVPYAILSLFCHAGENKGTVKKTWDDWQWLLSSSCGWVGTAAAIKFQSVACAVWVFTTPISSLLKPLHHILSKQSCPSHTFILIVFILREVCPSILNRACCSCDNSVAFYKSKWCIVVITLILNFLFSIKILILN